MALGGAMKNVLAIACGISDGRQLGDSARAALITRSFTELSRFGKAMGARPDTLMGLSGLGDLLLTCTSPQSRNYSAGHRIGRGASARDAIAATPGTVEGAHTAQVAVDLARRHGIDMADHHSRSRHSRRGLIARRRNQPPAGAAPQIGNLTLENHMLFVIICTDKPASLELRVATRPAHLAYLEKVAVKGAGPFIDDAGNPNGSLVIIEAKDLAEARAIAAADPYAQAGTLCFG